MIILPSITTTNKHSKKSPNWMVCAEQANELNLKKLGLFPTGINHEQRKKLYEKLEKIDVELPYVHLRHDFTVNEMDYLIKRFGTKIFNIHAQDKHTLVNNLTKYKDIIYVENCRKKFVLDELETYAGLCLDFAHLEHSRIDIPETYQYFIQASKKYKVGISHISAIKPERVYDHEHDQYIYDWHVYENLNEFDYLKKYKDMLPEINIIELENSIEEQLRAIEYIENLLK